MAFNIYKNRSQKHSGDSKIPLTVDVLNGAPDLCKTLGAIILNSDSKFTQTMDQKVSGLSANLPKSLKVKKYLKCKIYL